MRTIAIHAATPDIALATQDENELWSGLLWNGAPRTVFGPTTTDGMA